VRIAVIGAGSWGTTLADLLVTGGHTVRLWALEPDVAESINRTHVNHLYLADSRLAEALVSSADLGEAAAGAELLVSAVPSHAVRDVMARLVSAWNPEGLRAVVSVSKGLEEGTLETMTDVLRDVIPHPPAVALSGPSFAQEVFARQPTAVVAASDAADAAALVQRAFSSPSFRVYTSDDALGVQLAGALKNVIAIAAGVLHGLRLGHNTMSALVTRGLAELTRLGQTMGANPMTFAGLAGKDAPSRRSWPGAAPSPRGSARRAWRSI
jgi:glycerol-3-phosphate dehydrogenase (NAD(P)+)